MDTGGKDGTIKHVFSGVNPQGCRVSSFKAPSAEEANHDFLWRYHKSAPARGRIGIFNRSHYEDVLVVRVKDLVPEEVWRERYAPDQRLRAQPLARRHNRTQVLPAHLQGRAETPPPVPPRQPGQALEVLLGTTSRSAPSGTTTSPAFEDAINELLHRPRPLVRRAGQQEVVPQPRRRPHHRRHPRGDGPAVPPAEEGSGAVRSRTDGFQFPSGQPSALCPRYLRCLTRA